MGCGFGIVLFQYYTNQNTGTKLYVKMNDGILRLKFCPSKTRRIRMGKTIAVSNMKGGVGKTMTAASLGAGLAKKGKRVLCLDADAQHSLTVSFGIKEPGKIPVTLAALIILLVICILVHIF